jgi:hypothetical protein
VGTEVFYFESFVDRDMFMRYFGGGVGHYQVSVPDADADEPGLPDDDEDVAGGASDLPANEPEETDLDSDEEKEEEEEEEEEEDDDEEEDEIEDEEEDEDSEKNEEEEFGPDDGEDGVDDLTAQFGYDEL